MSYNKLGFTSGQTLKAEHLNHMEEGIANAGGVSSWNDLTDKPFGEEVTTIEVIPETTIEIASNGGSTTVEKSVIFKSGKSYKVILDGVEYNSVAFMDSGTNHCLGNLGVVQGDVGDGEPFFIGEMPNTWFIAVQTSGTHTISVKGETEEIKQIDAKFVPYLTYSWNNLIDKPFGEEISATYLGEVAGANKTEGSQGVQYITLSESLSTRFSNTELTDTFQMKMVDSEGVCVGIYDSVVESDGTVRFSANASFGALIDIEFIIPSGGTSVRWNPYYSGGSYNLALYTLEFYEVSTTYHRLDEKYLPESVEGVVIRSSTADSTKKFKLTVDDSGTITATEV